MTMKLLARGDRVVACVRRVEPLEPLAGERLVVARFDVTDIGAMRDAVAAAFAREHIAVVVSSAAYGLFGAAEELSDTQIEQQISTNLTGSIQLIRAVLPHLRAQGGGRLLQVSSEGGQIAYPSFSLYHATKWGIEGFVESVAQEVQPFGIDFTIIEPGPRATGFGAALDVAPPMAAYTQTPSAAVRRAIADGSFRIRGDAERTAEAMIAAGDAEKPARRVVLGSTAFTNIQRALTARLDELNSQRALAHSADQP